MELIPVDYTQDYKAYKAELDTELNKAAEGFVKIGYLLKVARDTNVLKESGYTSVAEFAAAEYGLTKDVVSRYIAINDRFSENGYSPCLADQYSSFGSAKLQEMLTLPDSILEHISSDTTKAEIQLIKKEYAEEQSISDIEVAIEAEELIQRHQEQSQYPYRQNGTTPSNNMEQLIYDYYHVEPEEYSRLFNSSDIYEQLVPTGIKTTIRLYNTIIIIAVIISVIAAVNFAILFRYILRKRQQQIACMRVCGLKYYKTVLYYVGECMLITLPAYILTTLCFAKWILPWMSDFYRYGFRTYNRMVYVCLFGIYFATSVVVLFIMLLTSISKNNITWGGGK